MFVFRSALRKGAASVRFYKSKPKMLRYDSKLKKLVINFGLIVLKSFFLKQKKLKKQFFLKLSNFFYCSEYDHTQQLLICANAGFFSNKQYILYTSYNYINYLNLASLPARMEPTSSPSTFRRSCCPTSASC